ncbi:hypothetical protein [Fibrobacter sp.]|uniref:hypothetical protein n=1 Tax=Fibrobacter sp. TaxID=35828 RepID=UPI00388DDD33
MFFNLSNHPHTNWGNTQLKAAHKWGEIIDIPFPDVKGQSSEQDILVSAQKCLQELKVAADDAIFVAGEYGTVFPIVDELLDQGKTVLSSVSINELDYRTGENGAHERTIRFNFVNFVPYRKFPGLFTPVEKKHDVVLNCNGNRPVDTWDSYEKDSISRLGTIEDFPIEDFSFQDTHQQDKTIEGILSNIDDIAPKAIILGGVFYQFFLMADVLIRKGYDVYVKASDRKVSEQLNPDGTSTKISEYSFKKLRKIWRFNSLGDHNG